MLRFFVALYCRTDDMWYAEDRLVRFYSYFLAVVFLLIDRHPHHSHYYQGPERIKSLYAFRSILDHGGRITLGSDMPVEGVNPLAGFYAAITRLTEEGTSPHGPEGWCVSSVFCPTPRRFFIL